MSGVTTEQKIKRVKVGCFLFVVALSLLAGYSFYSFQAALVFEDAGISVDADQSTKKERNSEFYEINKSYNYTGRQNVNDSVYSYALFFTMDTPERITYRLDHLVNWKSRPSLRGTAILDTESILSKDHKIITRDNEYEPAFRFIDEANNCSIEILLSKQIDKNANFIAQVFEVCEGDTKPLTSMLWYK